jgi:hypothetical protein
VAFKSKIMVKVVGENGVKPTTDIPITNGKMCNGKDESKISEEIKLKREIGLLEAVAIIIGCIIGSGILLFDTLTFKRNLLTILIL